jgi:acetyl-CoA carboxylase biotin carboxylase subunit
MMMINKVLVANRGEIAIRIMRTCKELGFQTVAVFSEPDRETPFVRYADEAYCIGPAAARDSYLRGDRIIRVALQCRAQAIHPGYGFLAESAEFAQAVAAAGLIFVGPKPETIALMGNKINARRLADRLGLPVLPATASSLDDGALLSAAEGIEFPVMIKAVAGGGGLGIRPARSRSELKASLPPARQEAYAAFGDGSLYIERLIENARHIEVQLMGDMYGRVIHLGERECSIQRRHQKLIEEAPSRALSEPLRSKILEAAVRVGRASGYVSAGTVEFLLTPGGEIYFLEVNPRLQVEHTVTEATTGLDIVKEQLRIGAGRDLSHSQQEIQPRGWALECRILAQDPLRGVSASVGQISHLVQPGGPGVRVDSGITQGQLITHYYDSLLAKLITWGETRGEAIVRMRRALDEFQIQGIATNLALHRSLLNNFCFFGGQFDTSFLEQQLAPPAPEESTYLAAALASALHEWRKRSGPLVRSGKPSNAWKMLGRWHLQGGDGL